MALREVLVTKACAAAGNYTAEDVISESATVGTAWTFADIADKGGYGYIAKARVACETTALTPRLTLFLFKENPSSAALNDNVANTAVLNADADIYIGKIDFPALEDLGTGISEAIASPSTTGNLPLALKCKEGSNTLYGILVTRDAITGEVAGDDYHIELTAEIPD